MFKLGRVSEVEYWEPDAPPTAESLLNDGYLLESEILARSNDDDDDDDDDDDREVLESINENESEDGSEFTLDPIAPGSSEEKEQKHCAYVLWKVHSSFIKTISYIAGILF
jgi:hypothetical protein